MQALANSAQTVDNSYIARRIDAMRENVERGESVLRAAITTKIFTPIVLQMVAVGEESGALDEMMDEIGEMYQRDVEYELKTLGAQIEPILIVALGGHGADSGARRLPADVGSWQSCVQALTGFSRARFALNWCFHCCWCSC
jgi:hypothetical protein